MEVGRDHRSDRSGAVSGHTECRRIGILPTPEAPERVTALGNSRELGPDVGTDQEAVADGASWGGVVLLWRRSQGREFK